MTWQRASEIARDSCAGSLVVLIIYEVRHGVSDWSIVRLFSAIILLVVALLAFFGPRKT
jgi:hypothetical protein